MSVICQAQPLTGVFVVEPEPNAVFPNQSFSIKRNQHRCPGSPLYIFDTNDCKEPDSPPDIKPHIPDIYGILPTLIEFMRQQCFFTVPLLIPYQLILTTKDSPSGSDPYSWLPLKVVITACWLLKSDWPLNSPLFKPIEQQEASQRHSFATITMMFGSGDNQQSQQPSVSSIQIVPDARALPTRSFTNPLNSDSGGGNGDPQQHLHTFGLNCFILPCHGVCQFRTSPDSGLPTGWPQKSAESSTVQTGAGQSSCPDLTNSRIDHFNLLKTMYSQQNWLFQILNGPAIQLQCTSVHPSQTQSDHVQPRGLDSNPTSSCKLAYSVSSGASDSDSTGPVRADAQVLEKFPVSNDDLVVINGLLNLGNHIRLEKSGGSCAFTDLISSMRTSETPQKTTESSQWVQSPPQLFQRGSIKAPAASGKVIFAAPNHKTSHAGEPELTRTSPSGYLPPSGSNRCQQARSNRIRTNGGGQQTCEMTLVGEDGQSRPCGVIFKNARSLSSHKSRYHSGQKTCDLTKVGKDGQLQPCGKVFSHSLALAAHKGRAHIRPQTCDVTMVREDGQPQPCGTVCEDARALTSHKRSAHKGQQKICDMTVIGKNGQPRPCGKVCNNSIAQSYHKRKYHTGLQTCDVTVIGEDGLQQSCGKVCRSTQDRIEHRNKEHTGQQICYVRLVGEDGQLQQCGKVFRNIPSLSVHKSKIHNKQKTCDETVVTEDGQSWPCRVICKNDKILMDHKRRHRKRKPVDVDQDNDLTPEKAKMNK
ncbi:hypothetical protein [Endozoicomonas sp. 8E]|uniref:hypothetical protein n=1 Tax=Endozoicomonas sp. 8E TaxID=3035692 RepID=UPI0029392958|nr:hypothetical protein [Endozoicomonas sp. 8E]WOG26550.1 hypothetical protein P6910_18650 [Endozoicomonas sp. 8E]